jgi:fused signal recognition particle receptor
MILWWGKKKKPDPKTGETPIEPHAASAATTPPAAMPPAPIPSAIAPPVVKPTIESAPAPLAAPPQGPATVEDAAAEETRKPGFFARLTEGLRRSSSRLADGLTGVFTRRKLDRSTLEELEELLITSDMGARAAAKLTAAVSRDRFEKDVSEEEVRSALADGVAAILRPREQHVDFSAGPRPRVVLFVGVNGSGKTTTIGKIAWKLSRQGADVTLAAGDTFRAAAVEQLKIWAERSGARFVSKPQGADSAALAYEAVEIARNENRDLVLIDTAGRLQNKAQLMDELAKVVRAIRKVDPDAPHDVILVLDATVGQNALLQVDAFRHTAGVTGLVMTKLDGTAKGGVLVAIAEAYDLPIHFVGVGETAEDLHPFSADAFARALVGLERTSA